MKLIRAAIIFFAIFAITASAQPQNDWIRFYGGNFQDTFTDVFGNTDGGYAMSGQFESGNRGNYDMWIVRVEPEGEQLWSFQYGTDEYEAGMSLIQTDAGGFFSGGYTGGRNNQNGWDFAGVLTDAEGQEIWWQNYGGEGHEQCEAVIELKDGNFLMAGYTDSFGAGERDGYLIKIDGEGEMLWDQTYGMLANDEFYAMREIEDGILLAGYTTLGENRDFWLVRTDDMGEEIWSRNFGGQNTDYCRSLISCRGGGFAMAGTTFDHEMGQSNIWVLRLNNEMNPIWDVFIDTDGGEFGLREYCYSVCQNQDGGFTLVGFGMNERGGVSIIARIDNGGNLMWTRHDQNQNNNRSFTNHYASTILAPDGAIIAAGNTSINNMATQGTLIKLVPERSAPIIIATIPDQLEFSVLPGDSVFFEVEAVDAQNDTLFYTWKLNGEEVSTDTCCTQTFEELSDNIMQCLVSDGDQADSVAWLVHVKEFYISEFSPESTNLEIRRNEAIDFTHQIRALEGLEFEYFWEHTGRGGDFEIEGEDSIRYQFDLSGEHLINANVSCGEEIEEIEWHINVQSIIWWWWPHENELTVRQDTLMEFEVSPFDEQSDSIAYRWELDGDVIGETRLIELAFPDAGQKELVAYVTEGEEADTVLWEIEVQERSFITDLADLTDVPTTPVLYPASPNPFNSVSSISFYIPTSDRIQIKVFDQNGREVETLVNQFLQAGKHQVRWDANDFSNGIYLLQMKGADHSFATKVALIR